MRQFALHVFALAVLSAPVGLSVAEAQDLSAPAKPSRYEEIRRDLNVGTMTIMASQAATAYTRFSEDMQNVLDENTPKGLRILPVLGRGGAQNMIDVLFLEKIDMGITEQDVIDELKKKDPGLYGNVENRLRYILKLTNSEMHIFARPEIKKLEDLRGKKVNYHKPLSSSALAMEKIMSTCGIQAEITNYDTDLAMEKLRSGEIVAAGRISGAPHEAMVKFNGPDGHFLPLDEENLPRGCYNKLMTMYLPAYLKSDDYPKTLKPGEMVPTVASATILTVYNLPEDGSRYRNVARFTEKLFTSIDKFRDGPRHPKWKEVNIAAEVPGWTRFKAAQQWIDANLKDDVTQQTGSDEMRQAFAGFLEEYGKKRGGPQISASEKQALFNQFMEWWSNGQQQTRGGRATR